MSISMPEQPLLLYPSLVEKHGLEEAVLLGCYQQLASLMGSDQGEAVVVSLGRQQWLNLAPFWDEEKLATLTNQLVMQQVIEAAFEGDAVTIELFKAEPTETTQSDVAELEIALTSQDESTAETAEIIATAADLRAEPMTEETTPELQQVTQPEFMRQSARPEEPLTTTEAEPPLLNVPVDELPESSPFFDGPVTRLLAEEKAVAPAEPASSLLDGLVPGREPEVIDDNNFRVEVEPVDRLPVMEEPPEFMQPVHRQSGFAQNEPPYQPQAPQQQMPPQAPSQPLVPGRGPAPTFGGSTGWARNRQANRARTGDELQEIFQQREVRNQQLHAIFVGWQPSDSFFALLPHHGIPEEFARECIDGFILYWLDKDRRETNWDSKFLGWVKREWVHKQTAAGRQQRQEQEQQKGFVNNENTRTDSRAKRQRVTRAIMDIRDTDW